MTLAGWAEIALILLLVLAAAWPLGLFMARVFNGERTFLSPVLGPVERGFYRRRRRRSGQGAGLARLYAGHACAQRHRLPVPLFSAARARLPAAQSARLRRGQRASVVQHGDQLRHQHQLAVLWRRDDHGPSGADDRLHRSEFPVGGDRHRAGDCGDPCLCAQRIRRRSAISGSI